MKSSDLPPNLPAPPKPLPSKGFAEKFARLTAHLAEQFAESARLEAAVVENLRSVELSTCDAG